MMRAFVALALLLLVGCRERTAPSPQPVPAPSVASASAASVAPAPGLLLSSDITAEGVRVMTGSWHGAWGVSDVEPDPRQTQLRIVSAPHGSTLERLMVANTLVLVNGGYFEADYRPSTWLVDRTLELAPKSDTSKGGVFALRSDELFIGSFSDLHFAPTLAIQSFPLLVEAGGRMGIHKDDGRRAARTIACRSEGKLHFIVIAAPRGDGPTLLETAELLQKPRPRGFGCDVALNLDGGPSSGVWFAPAIAAKSRLPFAPVAYAVAVLRPQEN